MSPLGLARLELYAGGATVAEIAARDEITRGAVIDAMRRAVWQLSRRATPGSILPDGLAWRAAPWADGGYT